MCDFPKLKVQGPTGPQVLGWQDRKKSQSYATPPFDHFQNYVVHQKASTNRLKFSNLELTQGRVRLPNRMNFWKTWNFKQGFLIMKLIQNRNFRVFSVLLSTIVLCYTYIWKSCACISYYLAIIPPRIYATISVIKNLQYNFRKMKGGGRRPFGIFSKKIISFGSRTLPLTNQLVISNTQWVKLFPDVIRPVWCYMVYCTCRQGCGSWAERLFLR